MKRALVVFVLVLVSMIVARAAATGTGGDSLLPGGRVSALGGMGVDYVNVQDVVNLVNASVISGGREPEFKAAVIFFGGVVLPVSESWSCKVEYAYLLGSYSISGFFGNTEFTFISHMPSILFQYLLASEPTYTVRVGAGGGYHFGELHSRVATIEDRYSGKGLGVLLDLEGNTAFGESLFGYLGLEMRWDFVGRLTDPAGRTPGPPGSETTMHFFGAGAKFGFSYFF